MSIRYCTRLLSLWLQGKITGHTVIYALRQKPAAVAGKGGAFILKERP